MRWWLIAVLGAGIACSGPGPQGASEPTVVERFRIVATERGPSGGRLVWIDEDGRRMRDVLPRGDVAVSDIGAEWSPDGRWLVFASSRGRRQMAETNLWIVSTEPGSRPHRLSTRDGIESHPTWTPDSKAIVYAAIDRGGTSYDLWRAELDTRGPSPRLVDPRKLTDTADVHERFPSVSPDGAWIAYERANDELGASIWRIPAAGGTAERITDGPADLMPRYAPSGEAIAFCRGADAALPNGGTRLDIDVYMMPASGGKAARLVPEPYADQVRPRFTRDGRFLFVTSVYRTAETDEMVLGSITFIDLAAKKLDLYALHDRGGVNTRVDVALSPTGLIAAELVTNETYRQALYRVLVEEHERQITPPRNETRR